MKENMAWMNKKKETVVEPKKEEPKIELPPTPTKTSNEDDKFTLKQKPTQYEPIIFNEETGEEKNVYEMLIYIANKIDAIDKTING
jgi:hypothetical protein